MFNPEFSENGTEIQPLKDAVKNGEVGSLEVDKESFKIIGSSLSEEISVKEGFYSILSKLYAD